MSDEDARQAVLSRLGTRLDAVDDARRAAEARGDTTRLAKLDVLAKLLSFEIQLEETDPEPLPGREDEVILLGGRAHATIVTKVPADAKINPDIPKDLQGRIKYINSIVQEGLKENIPQSKSNKPNEYIR